MHIAIKSFDLIIALTSGGPGYASDVPSTFMYTYSFTRYIYSELRGANNEH